MSTQADFRCSTDGIGIYRSATRSVVPVLLLAEVILLSVIVVSLTPAIAEYVPVSFALLGTALVVGVVTTTIIRRRSSALMPGVLAIQDDVLSVERMRKKGLWRLGQPNEAWMRDTPDAPVVSVRTTEEHIVVVRLNDTAQGRRLLMAVGAGPKANCARTTLTEPGPWTWWLRLRAGVSGRRLELGILGLLAVGGACFVLGGNACPLLMMLSVTLVVFVMIADQIAVLVYRPTVTIDAGSITVAALGHRTSTALGDISKVSNEAGGVRLSLSTGTDVFLPLGQGNRGVRVVPWFLVGSDVDQVTTPGEAEAQRQALVDRLRRWTDTIGGGDDA